MVVPPVKVLAPPRVTWPLPARVRDLAPPMTPWKFASPWKVTVLSARRVTGPVSSELPPLKVAVAPNWIGLAKGAEEVLMNLPPETTRVAAPSVPVPVRLIAPAFTVTVEAAVRVEAP